MKISVLIISIITFFCLFKLLQFIKNNISKKTIKITIVAVIVVILLVIGIAFVKNNSSENFIKVIKSFLNKNLKPSEVISMCALIFTLFSYSEKNIKEQKDSLKKQDMDTFFKLLEILSKKSQEIPESECKEFINGIKIKLNQERTFQVHKAYLLNKVLKEHQALINEKFQNNHFDIKKKMDTLINSDNFETMFKLMNSPNFKSIVDVETSEKRRTYFFSNEEMQTLNSIGVLSIISDNYSNELIQKSPITYKHAYNIINRSFDNNKNGDFFRVLHRAIKIIKSSEIENKSKFYGIIRAVLPDYLLIYIYYNSVFTEKGLGLGLQLSGTSFFGEKDDFFFKDDSKKDGILDFTQHIPKNYLIFKRQDPQIMIKIFSKKNYESIKDLQSAYESVLDSTKIQYNKSFNVKEIN